MEKMVWVHKNLEDFNVFTASNVINILTLTIESKGYANLLLSGGSTPVSVYQTLAQDKFQKSISWERIRFFWGDERCVPPGDKNSNYGQAFEMLLSKVPVDPDNIHRINGELGPREATEVYRHVLSDHAPAGKS